LTKVFVNVLANILRVHRHQPHFPVCKTIEVDDAHATTLAAPLDYPADLATATRAGDNIASFWIEGKPGTKVTELFWSPVLRPRHSENLCLSDGEHMDYTP
jgi:hypothetical protein